MASYHLSVKTVQRSAGRSATAAIAYRTASRVLCEREGRVHDYRAKAGVEATLLLVPKDAPPWAHDRQVLWNAAEARETRSNSVTAREWELALPAELDGEGRRLLVEGFARELVARYGVAADVAIHAPHREGDQRNWHAHVLTTTRVLTPEGLTDKTRVLDAKQTGGPEIEHMRARWAEMQNHALEQQGHAVRVDHRSLAAQREVALVRGDALAADNLDRAPEVKLGPVVSAIERREQRTAEKEEREYVPLTERGAQVHEARQVRGLLQELGQIREALRREMQERAALARETYAQARENGTDRVRAGLAALRAAVQRQEGGHEDGRGREAARDSIRERLANLRGQGTEQGHERTAEAARQPGPGHGLDEIRERLARILEQESQRTHEGIRERLNEALGRAKPVAQERPAHSEAHERDTPRQGQRGHGEGWGL